MSFSNTQGADISYYQGAVNFIKMRDYGFKFVILRLGYAVYQDKRFTEYMINSAGVLPRTVYHYYDPIHPPLEQANKVLSILAPYKAQIKRVWLDFEFTWGGDYTAPQHWLTYRNAIRAAGYRTGIYTRASWWDSRVGSYANEFATDPAWVAQYNTSLTLIPLGWKSKPEPRVMIWQKGTPAIGIAAGVSSQEIDLDVWNDDFSFADEWGTVSPPPPPVPSDVIDKKYKGITRITGTRFGRRVFITITDPKLVRYEVVHEYNATSNVARSRGATIGRNGGEWDKRTLPYRPIDYAVSNGWELIPRFGRPSFLVFNDGTVAIDHKTKTSVRQAATGLRYLVENGAISPTLDITDTYRTARTLDGVTADGKHISVVVEGENQNNVTRYGVTLKEAALIMLEFGAVKAFDQGGGGDSVDYYDGGVRNIPEDISNGVHVERFIPQHLLIYAQQESTMADYIEYTATGNRAIRTSYGVTKPRIAQFSDLLVNKKANGEPLMRLTLTASDIPTTGGMVGDVWVHVYTNDGIAVNGWTALKHNGDTQLTERLVTAPTTPPPTSKPDLNITIAADGYQSVQVTLKPQA